MTFSQNPLITEDSKAQKKWVDSIYRKMTLDQKIGQLFMITADYPSDLNVTSKAEKLIKEYQIGGIIFFKGSPTEQAKMTNRLQEESKVPLIVGIDGEWGLSMRLDSVPEFPWNMTLGATRGGALAYQVGEQIGKQCKRMGIHINFAPDIDINSNPKNPIIGNRSFGEDKANVTEKGVALFQGIQSQGVLACGKHFPGHGDTSTDSHKALPIIDKSKLELENTEIYPFKKVIDSGISSIMIGHLDVPSLDASGLPSSLSEPIITDVLKNSLDFNGLIFTDALNMKGVSDFKGVSDIGFESFKAGSDMLVLCENVPKTIRKIKKNYLNNSYIKKRVEESVKKILLAKYFVGLNHYSPVSTNNLIKDLDPLSGRWLNEELASQVITVIKNDSILPIKALEKEKIAYVNFGSDSGDILLKYLKLYTEISHINSDLSVSVFLKKLKPYTKVIIGFHSSNKSPWENYQFKTSELEKLQALAVQNDVILDVFASAYSLKNIPLKNIKGVVISYQNSALIQSKSAQLIFGAISAKGKLPVSISDEYKADLGLETSNLLRLKYGLPESTGMSNLKQNFKK